MKIPVATENPLQVYRKVGYVADRLTIDEFFRSLPVPVFLLNEDRRVEKMSPAAAAIVAGLSGAGGDGAPSAGLSIVYTL